MDKILSLKTFFKKYQTFGLLLCAPLFSQAPCPNTVGGYIGNLGDTSGNCAPLPHNFPSLSAFGSMQINQNTPMGALNRLNPTQKPMTNNWQNFQNPCSIFDTSWTYDPCTPGSIPTGAGATRVRTGAYLVGMARTGPIVTVPQFNLNINPATPNIITNPTLTTYFSATETNGTATDYFDVSTNIVNTETCLITYTPKNGAAGTIIDYNVTGNAFHDVYYENLTPDIAFSNPFVIGTNSITVGIGTSSSAGAILTTVPIGGTMVGSYFQFFLQRYNGVGPTTIVIYAQDATESNVTINVVQQGNGIFLIFQNPFTGFLRLAAISTNDPMPASVGVTWTQSSFYMPEDVCNPSDTSRPSNPLQQCVGATNPPFISTCAVEDPACGTNTVQSPSWWKTAEVDCIAPTGLDFYLLYPHDWTNLLSQLSRKTIGPDWPGASPFTPSNVGLSDFLPTLATSGYVGFSPAYPDSYEFAHHYYDQFAISTAPTQDPSDPATNLFLVEFDMAMGFQKMSDIIAFQASRTVPSYIVPGPVNSSFNIDTYTAHRRYIPVMAEIGSNSSSIEWSYTLTNLFNPGSNSPLVTFPLWKYVAPGTNVQNFIYNDTIKGTLYAAECNNGLISFIEKGMPSWYSATDPFIPSSLSFTGGQIINMQTAYNRVLTTVNPPLPQFGENDLNDGYTAGKRAFMLAKTAVYGAYFLNHGGSPITSLVADLQPCIDNAKSILTDYLVGRRGGANYFVADPTGGGICVNGAGGIGVPYAQGPNLQHAVDAGEDFGNYIYNDHHFFAGYYLVSAALVTYWEKYINPPSSGTFWIDLEVQGGDYNAAVPTPYHMRNFVDFLWRDTHNPFKDDPDLPYDRYGYPWEGHGIASGLQYNPNSLGRNQESIAEDFHCWVGLNTYANLVLTTSTTLNPTDITTYQAVLDFSTINLQLNASSAAVQWFKNLTSMTSFSPVLPLWKGINMYLDQPAYLGPSIYIGQFSQTTVQNGEINDTSVQNQTFF